MYRHHRALRGSFASRAANAYHANASWKWLRVLLQAEASYKVAWDTEEAFPRIG
jgi:hypothetical protein